MIELGENYWDWEEWGTILKDKSEWKWLGMTAVQTRVWESKKNIVTVVTNGK